MHLVQVIHPVAGRRVALVEEPKLLLLDNSIGSTFHLFREYINQHPVDLISYLNQLVTRESLDYSDVYFGKSPWKLSAPIDCPDNPMNCLLSGTGLTHKASAQSRNKMHDDQQLASMTDSMKMYLWGEAGGKNPPIGAGVQPEWFLKGNGSQLKAHGALLQVPEFADDGGEEAEIAGVYLISEQGVPFRLGFVQANEFSDHVMEKKNYLYLAPSKLRDCSIGPELVLDESFENLEGEVNIYRKAGKIWGKQIRSGQTAMVHSLDNLEYHHFKYDQHRLPGQLHIHFFGTGAFSFNDQISMISGDIMEIAFNGMGRPLRNAIEIEQGNSTIPEIRSLIP